MLPSHHLTTNMDPPYSAFLFNHNHAANKPTTRPPTRYCCFDAYTRKDYILCATCPNLPRKKMFDDGYDDYDDLPAPAKEKPVINHDLSNDFEGPLWE